MNVPKYTVKVNPDTHKYVDTDIECPHCHAKFIHTQLLQVIDTPYFYCPVCDEVCCELDYEEGVINDIHDVVTIDIQNFFTSLKSKYKLEGLTDIAVHLSLDRIIELDIHAKLKEVSREGL